MTKFVIVEYLIIKRIEGGVKIYVKGGPTSNHINRKKFRQPWAIWPMSYLLDY